LYVQVFGKLIGDIYEPKVIEDILKKTVNAHDELIEHRGTKHGTKHWKELTQYCTSLLEGRKPKPMAWTKIGNTDRWPHRFGFMRPIYHDIINGKKDSTQKEKLAKLRQFLNTLFKINKVCEGYRELDVEHLFTSFTLKNQTMVDFEKFVIKRIDPFRESQHPDSNPLVTEPFFGPANGPNGKPKLLTADMEAYGLVNSDLFKYVKDISMSSGNSSFIDYILFRSEQYELKPAEDKLKPEDIVLRKLTSIPDKGNKSRVIAISDIWTQAVLKPVEEQVIRATQFLYGEKCAFFGHTQGWDRISALPESTQSRLVSLDAEKWTDYLPSSLQLIVMRRIFGQHLALAWKGLAVECPWKLGSSHRYITYGRGQGMGTKGSFAIAQLTNLLFIDFLLEKHYGCDHSLYFIEVGDDMVIEDPDYLLRQEFEDIGVPINVGKTKHSTDEGSFVEFVSRNMWNGMDYSVVSPRLTLLFRRNPFYILTYLRHLNERCIDKFTFDDLIEMHKSNTDREIHVEKIKYLSHIFSIVDDSNTVEIRNVTYVGDPKKFLLNFFHRVICQLIVDYVAISQDRDTQVQIARRNNFVDQLKFQDTEDGKTDFWSFALSKDMDPETLQFLFVGVTMSHKEEESKIGGIEFTKHDNSMTTFLEPLSDGNNIVNPNFLHRLFSLYEGHQAVKMRKRTIARLGLQDGANHRSALRLFELLNSCLVEEDIYTNGIYKPFTKKKGKEQELPEELFLQFLQLFQLEQNYQEIKSLISTTTSTMSWTVSDSHASLDEENPF
jgi:hypothetical protein